MWVRLRVSKYVERNGKQHKYPPGETINVGRTTAMEWIAACDAVLVEAIVSKALGNVGFVVSSLERATEVLRGVSETPIVTGPARCEFSRTCILDTSANVRPDLFQAGFNLLAAGRWQAAAPLWSYTELACHIGTDEDRYATKAVIRDLRVPLYDTRVLFVRRCDDTRRLLALWLEECKRGDTRLAFLRAMYQVKPVLCALPAQWTGRA